MANLFLVIAAFHTANGWDSNIFYITTDLTCPQINSIWNRCSCGEFNHIECGKVNLVRATDLGYFSMTDINKRLVGEHTINDPSYIYTRTVLQSYINNIESKFNQ